MTGPRDPRDEPGAPGPDERVLAAVAHWAPRFTTNGVTVSDFQSITGGIARWEDWCAAWSAVGEQHAALGDQALAQARTRSAGAHYAQAAAYFHFGKFLFVNDPEQMRAAHDRAVACLNAALPHLDPPGQRVEVPFEGSRLVGVLRIPAGAGPHPAVLMIPGLDSAKEEFGSTEQLFLDRGMATFSVDGPGQGEAEYDLPIRGDWEVPGAALLDALAAMPEIDADRLAVWGVSLGGYYAPRVASGDARIRACIALAGPWDFGDCWDQLPALTRAAFRVRSRSADDEQARRRAHELSLTGRAGQISCPLLIVFGKRDRLIPWQHASRLAAEAGGPTELLLLEDGNHGCMNVAPQHRLRSADWMAAQLAVGGP
ncbi:MAG TPA: alpha/beta hydrolase [Mycobacteriales bacterium]|nr:alpha/beta hydrolase [Mycobacteriales bacterium]